MTTSQVAESPPGLSFCDSKTSALTDARAHLINRNVPERCALLEIIDRLFVEERELIEEMVGGDLKRYRSLIADSDHSDDYSLLDAELTLRAMFLVTPFLFIAHSPVDHPINVVASEEVLREFKSLTQGRHLNSEINNVWEQTKSRPRNTRIAKITRDHVEQEVRDMNASVREPGKLTSRQGELVRAARSVASAKIHAFKRNDLPEHEEHELLTLSELGYFKNTGVRGGGTRFTVTEHGMNADLREDALPTSGLNPQLSLSATAEVQGKTTRDDVAPEASKPAETKPTADDDPIVATIGTGNGVGVLQLSQLNRLLKAGRIVSFEPPNQFTCNLTLTDPSMDISVESVAVITLD